jgi:hypothetical protein
MFGWVGNSRITIVLGIGITIMYPNANLLFQNSENSCYSAIPWGSWNSGCSSQLFITISNKRSIQYLLPFGITSHFYYPRAYRKIMIVSLFSCVILNFFILMLFFARSKDTKFTTSLFQKTFYQTVF